MDLFTYAVLFMFVSTFRGLTAIEEPVCTSRFDFEEKLLRKLVRMEHAVELLQERVSNELSAIKEEKAQMDQDFVKLKEAFITEQTVVKDKLADEFETLSQRYESKIQRISSDLTEALNKSLNNENVAFAVQQATGKLVNGVPTFKKVHVNVGNDYDVSTGKFTCSKDGLYSFTFILRTRTSNYVYCYIRLNGVSVINAISEEDNSMSSVTVYLSLTTGDVVDLGGCSNWNSSKIVEFNASFLGMQIN